MGLLLWSGIGFFVGCIVGVALADKLWRNSFKAFTDEMHEQYIYLLKKHGIETKKK